MNAEVTTLLSEDMKRALMRCVRPFAFGSLMAFFWGCGTVARTDNDVRHSQQLVVSVKEQRAYLLSDGTVSRTYVVSTALKGVGEDFNSEKTPRGAHAIAEKIGAELALGTVLVDRIPTGEIMVNEVANRTPITTRILRLKGLESTNQNTFDRYIYLHGTPVESSLGTAASGGCIRFKAADIIEIFELMPENAEVQIFEESFEDGMSEIRKKQEAVGALLELAIQNDPQSVHLACANYVAGTNGFHFDEQAAVRWCTAGSALNIPSSVTLLAQIYEGGKGVQTDNAKARSLYTKAALSGHPHALFKVGEMYLNGLGGPANPSIAKNYIDLAAFRGHKGAIELKRDLDGKSQ